MRATLFVLMATAVAAGAAQAETYPNRPVTLVVPSTPGGQTDGFSRALAEELSRVWHQPVIVENKPGGNTIVAATYVARSPADGYRILLANDSTFSLNPFLYKKLTYDIKEFVPVINLVASSSILVVEGSSPYKTVEQLVQAAKQSPGTLNYASWGEGSKTHLDTERLLQFTGAAMTHIPYKGAAETMTALMGKQVDVALAGISLAMPGIRSGRLRALAVSGTSRSPLVPSVPTLAEAGLKGVESRAWFGFFVPAGTPKEVTDKIAEDASAIINRPDFTQRSVIGTGYSVVDQKRDEFDKFLSKDRKEYQDLISRLNLKPNQ